MMRSVAFLAAAMASATASAQPKAEPVSVVPVDVDFCDFCKLATQDKVAGVATVEVWPTIAQAPDKTAGGDKPVYDLTIILRSGHENVGVHLDLRDGTRSWAVRETHRVAGYHDGIVTDRKATPNDAVALRFDIDRKREGGGTAKETLLLACSHPGAWACSLVRLDNSCKVTHFDPPAVGYTCGGELALTAHAK